MLHLPPNVGGVPEAAFQQAAESGPLSASQPVFDALP